MESNTSSCNFFHRLQPERKQHATAALPHHYNTSSFAMAGVGRGRRRPQGSFSVKSSVPAFLVGVLLGASSMHLHTKVNTTLTIHPGACQQSNASPSHEPNNTATAHQPPPPPPQIFNFVKEFNCRGNHLSTPPLLKMPGHNKVVVDIGLDLGNEFFAALEAGYSVYGFEANPLTAANLRTRCEAATTYKCVYVDGANITRPLPPIPNGGYLIEAGAGESEGEMDMLLDSSGSSFVEVSPHFKNKPETAKFRTVRVLPVSNVVDADVFFFKLDVQGFEFEALKGALGLFTKHVVKTMLVEVYPRGLDNAGVDFHAFLRFLWYDLGMFCSSSNGVDQKTFPMDHPRSLPEFAKYLKDMANEAHGNGWWGRFDDFYCFNRNKIWGLPDSYQPVFPEMESASRSLPLDAESKPKNR